MIMRARINRNLVDANLYGFGKLAILKHPINPNLGPLSKAPYIAWN